MIKMEEKIIFCCKLLQQLKLSKERLINSYKIIKSIKKSMEYKERFLYNNPCKNQIKFKDLFKISNSIEEKRIDYIKQHKKYKKQKMETLHYYNSFKEEDRKKIFQKYLKFLEKEKIDSIEIQIDCNKNTDEELYYSGLEKFPLKEYFQNVQGLHNYYPNHKLF
jgi:hypothetical protein